MTKETVGNYRCPLCQSDKRRIGDIVTELKAKKIIDQGVQASSRCNPLMIGNPNAQPKAGDIITVLFPIYDYCIDCGQEYCYQHDVEEVKVEIQKPKPGLFVPGMQQQPMPFNMPPQGRRN